jgi:hypothetical protein
MYGARDVEMNRAAWIIERACRMQMSCENTPAGHWLIALLTRPAFRIKKSEGTVKLNADELGLRTQHNQQSRGLIALLKRPASESKGRKIWWKRKESEKKKETTIDWSADETSIQNQKSGGTVKLNADVLGLRT